MCGLHAKINKIQYRNDCSTNIIKNSNTKNSIGIQQTAQGWELHSHMELFTNNIQMRNQDKNPAVVQFMPWNNKKKYIFE